MRHSQSVELGGSQDGGDDDGCPSLAKACLAVVVENFSDRPVPTDRLPSKLSNEIYSRLKDLDPSVGAQFVDDEKYWKRICHEKFGGANCNVEEHGLVWKRMFFELHLRTLLETYRDAGGTGLDELLDEVRGAPSSFCVNALRRLVVPRPTGSAVLPRRSLFSAGHPQHQNNNYKRYDSFNT